MDDLDRERVSELLTTTRLGRSFELRARTRSTNDDAREAIGDGAVDGHVIVADAQEQGRGSRGRAWSSPPGSDLYFSLVAEVAVDPKELPPLTLAVGLAVAHALEPHLPEAKRALVKWPNDVWVGRKKVAGILVESVSLATRVEPVVIGIGINVNRDTFPEEFAREATSLALESGAKLERSLVLAGVLNELERWLERFVREGAKGIVPALRERLAFRDQRVMCEGLEGTVVGIAESGALLLKDERGVHAIFAGTLRPCEDSSAEPA